MNIFYLDRDPVIAAQMMCDKHVVIQPYVIFITRTNPNGARMVLVSQLV